jgi:hypothetical protein
MSAMDAIRELLATAEAEGKVGARAISIDEAQQLLDNRWLIVRNPRRGRSRAQATARRLMIGVGRVLERSSARAAASRRSCPPTRPGS